MSADSLAPYGYVTVNGAGAELSMDEAPIIGAWGVGSLQVLGGGYVYDTDAAVPFLPIGNNHDPSSHSYVMVDGKAPDDTPSTWTTESELHVGRHAPGLLTITDGGVVNANNGAAIAVGSGAIGSYVAVAGTGSEWNVTGSLHVAGDSSGAGPEDAWLLISDGGRVDVSSELVAYGQGFVELSDAGSTLAAESIELKSGATFDTEPGTAVYANELLGFGDHPAFEGDLYLGHAVSATSVAGSYLIGAGQSLDVDGAFAVGNDLPGSLTVQGGGTVNSYRGAIGALPGSLGSGVSVDGSGSQWSVTESLSIGGDMSGPGGNAILSVQNNGAVLVGDTLRVWDGGSLLLGLPSYSLGSVAVQNRLELMTGGSIDVTANSFLGTDTLQLAGGALMTATGTFVYANHIEGISGLFRVEGTLGIGWQVDDAVGELTIGDSQILQVAETLVVGEGAATGTVSVGYTGTASTGETLIGSGRGIGSLNVYHGAQVTSAETTLGVDALSEGSAHVWGDGPHWQTGALTVGNRGLGELEIAVTALGGEVTTSGDAYIARYAGSAGSRATVGENGQWNISGTVWVGGGNNGDGPRRGRHPLRRD